MDWRIGMLKFVANLRVGGCDGYYDIFNEETASVLE
jgi:hypothetical protein